MRAIKTNLKKIIHYGGINGAIRYISAFNGIAILRYHAIVDSKDNFYAIPDICVSRKSFEQQVKYFTTNYSVITLDQLISDGNSDFLNNKPSVIFTFDDGYMDNYYAAEILKKYRVNGTFFVTAGCIGNEKKLWLSEVYYTINRTNLNKIVIVVNGKENVYHLQDKKNVLKSIMALIKSNDVSTREIILTQIRDQVNVKMEDYMDKDIMLTWEKIKSMIDMGMIIGGHTMTHCNLPNAKYEEAYNEIYDCKKVIENKTCTNIKHFSYPNSGPYDYYNDKVMEIVKNAGFNMALTSKQGLARRDNNNYLIPRIRVNECLFEVTYSLECERFFINSI